MKKIILPIVILFLAIIFFVVWPVSDLRAEDKPTYEAISPIPKTPNDPILIDAHVYPMWGPICQRYTYSVIYHDKEGRSPEYVRMYFNGDWIDLEKENPEDSDYKQGVKYIYKFVPKKVGSNFFFFEASNGLGKARAGIIDSPNNGPCLFESAFDKNEIALIDAATGQKIWSYSTGKNWVGGIALSDNGQYLVAQTTDHVYLFDTASKEPLWDYEYTGPYTVKRNDVKGGIDISGDGSRIFALIGHWAILFDKSSNKPLWQYDVKTQGHNAAISKDGKYMAVADADSDLGSELESIGSVKYQVVFWNADSSEPLWKFPSSGNFHDVSLSADGSFIITATGCPDRRGYLFSKNSSQPIWQTEMLTHDTPVHQAKASADGSTIVFGTESGEGALYLFSKNSAQAQWKFTAPEKPSFRAVSITPNGQYIGAATTIRGDVYIFDSALNEPIASWKVDTSFGAVDIADDGSFIVVGGTDNKVRIFERESKKERAAVTLGEHVSEIDISANGQYIAAGTSAAVYFFESLDINKTVSGVPLCEKIIEPEKEPEKDLTYSLAGAGEPILTYCGDGKCEGPETLESCSQDCDPNFSEVESKQDDKDLPLPGFTPDSPFYFLDTLGEKAGMFFTFNAEKKAEKALNYAEEKLAEAKSMAEKNKTKALERATQNYQGYLNIANEKVEELGIKGKDIEKLVNLISEKTLKHQEILLEVYEKVPEQAKEGIEKAIEVSKRGHEEAIKAVSKVKEKREEPEIKEVEKPEEKSEEKSEEKPEEKSEEKSEEESEKKPEEEPEEDLTKDWKTYRNEKYGFSFAYPKNFQLLEDRGSFTAVENPISFSLNLLQDIYTGLGQAPTIYLDVVKTSKTNDQLLDYVREVINEYAKALEDPENPYYGMPPPEIQSVETVIIESLEIIKVVRYLGPGGPYPTLLEYYIAQPEHVFVFSANYTHCPSDVEGMGDCGKTEKEILPRILSTFEFTEPIEEKWSIETVDSQDNPHISYFDYTNSNLKYATSTAVSAEINLDKHE